jgi:hypothetical protein
MSASCEFQAPRVPDQLEVLLDDHALEVHGIWREASLSDIKSAMPEPELINAGDRNLRAPILKPASFDGDLSQVLVVELPYQQVWKPSMYIRSEIARQIVAPDLPAVVFPNNNFRDDYYDFTDEEYERLNGGSIAPLSEIQVRALENLGVSKAAHKHTTGDNVFAHALMAKDGIPVFEP